MDAYKIIVTNSVIVYEPSYKRVGTKEFVYFLNPEKFIGFYCALNYLIPKYVDDFVMPEVQGMIPILVKMAKERYLDTPRKGTILYRYNISFPYVLYTDDKDYEEHKDDREYFQYTHEDFVSGINTALLTFLNKKAYKLVFREIFKRW